MLFFRDSSLFIWFPEICFEPLQPLIASPFEFKKALPKSFAQALKGICDIPSSQLPQAIVKEDRLSITILEEEYRVGLEECNNNLHGKILWPKGISPFSIFYLHKKLAIIWYELTGFNKGSLSFNYLRVSIFKEKLKSFYL